MAIAAYHDARIIPALGKERSADASGSADAVIIASPQTLGMASGAWCPYGMPGDLPADQRIDDGMAVVFETDAVCRSGSSCSARPC